MVVTNNGTLSSLLLKYAVGMTDGDKERHLLRVKKYTFLKVYKFYIICRLIIST